MRAVWYDRLGPADEVLTVGTQPTPSPGPGEVLVRVRASGINPSDVKKRSGWLGGRLDHDRVIPHSDGAGMIEAVGEGVSNDRLGERVWLYNAQWQRADGTAAEYVALPSALAVPLPDEADYVAAACLGVPACTAHYAVHAHGPVDGLWVLVQGGAGAVGHYAVQLAAEAGARVIATVSSEEKGRLAREAGADFVVDYKAEDVAVAVREITRGHGADRIVEVDLGSNIAVDAAVLAQRGAISAYSSTRTPRFELEYYSFGYRGARIAFVQVYMLTAAERAAAVAALDRLMRAGRLMSNVAHTLPLDRCAEAHRLQEAGRLVGNIVLTVD